MGSHRMCEGLKIKEGYADFPLSLLSGASYLQNWRHCCKCCADYRRDLVSMPYVWLHPMTSRGIGGEKEKKTKKQNMTGVEKVKEPQREIFGK